MKALLAWATVLACLLPLEATLAEFVENENGTATYANSPEGPFIDTDENGNFLRIWVIEREPVEFPDRRGIGKAQDVAEERARGRLIRYMGEQVTATRIVTEFQSDLSTAKQTRGTAQEPVVSKIDEREVIQALTEINTSFSEGRLRGITIIGEGYDDGLDEVWVRLGYSRASLLGAAAATNALTSNEPDSELHPSTDEKLGFQEGYTRAIPDGNW